MSSTPVLRYIYWAIVLDVSVVLAHYVRGAAWPQ
ncbi:hypothetical protein ABID19_002319 [Mesorhizobium robiniae]|uniref:Uncharacterized protein n=1 Tax=Mesorhizobium robiniae TaxID=559315 RepID=A0ABV2GMC4_9HYPH